MTDHPLCPDGADPDQICLAGDWHGNAPWAVDMLKRIDGHARVVLHVGDWGLRRESAALNRFLSQQNRQLAAMDACLVVTPGNHDDWSRLASLPVDPANGLRKLTNRIWFFPPGFRWQWGDQTWVSVGGAVSVDRRRRTEGRDWWPEEAVTDHDVERVIADGAVDVMVTHDAPARAHVPGLSAGRWPSDALADSDANRARLQRIVDLCRPRELWHGHMHVRYSDRLDLSRDGTHRNNAGHLRVHGLDSDQGRWQDNIVIVRRDGSHVAWDDVASTAGGAAGGGSAGDVSLS